MDRVSVCCTHGLTRISCRVCSTTCGVRAMPLPVSLSPLLVTSVHGLLFLLHHESNFSISCTAVYCPPYLRIRFRAERQSIIALQHAVLLRRLTVPDRPLWIRFLSRGARIVFRLPREV